MFSPNQVSITQPNPILILAGRHVGQALYRHALLKRIQGRPKLIVERDIRSVAAIADSDIASALGGLRGIKGIPTVTDIGLKPRMQIHGLKLVQIADNHASWNAEAAAQGYSQV